MGGLAKQSAVALATLPVKVFGVAQAIVGVKDRAKDSPVSIVGGGRIAGETASANDFPVKDKLVSLLFLVAGFNFFIGLFNFIPLLPLDGGHIAGALWEAAAPRDRPAARPPRPRVRRRRQAPAGRLRRGQLPARDGRGPDRGRPRRPGQHQLTRTILEAVDRGPAELGWMT